MGVLPPGNDELKPEPQHPLPSYLEYRHNASIRVYQTDYFASKCAESPDSNSKSFNIKLGAEMESLGGKCDPNQQKFCDGPLKPRTAYRLDVLPSFHQEGRAPSLGAQLSGRLMPMSSCRLMTYITRVLCILLANL